MIIDRFEGEFAIVEMEDGSFKEIPIECIPSNAKEGSILIITCDENGTEIKRREMKNKMNSIFKK